LNGDFSTRLMLIWFACAATVTLAPFDFTVPPPGEAWEFTAFSAGSRQQEPTHFVLNMLLFVPLGILAYWRRRHALLPRLILVGSLAFVVSFIVECLQRFLPGRESSLVDVAANTSGALLGVLISRAMGVEIGRCVKRWRASTPWLLIIAGLLSV
jgi:VanZ family protein